MSKSSNGSTVAELVHRKLLRQMRPPKWSPLMFRLACEAGCFQDVKVEFIGGRLVEMTENPPHMNCVYNVEATLKELLPAGRWFVARAVSARFPRWTPLPDVAIHRGPRQPTYENRLPSADDAVLIVDGSESTYLKDRVVKLARYAGAAIPTYWIVHLERQRVEVYSQPAGRRDMKREDYEETAEVPVVLDGVLQGSIAVRDIRPRRKASEA
jgi:Uma2 family endonuclease